MSRVVSLDPKKDNDPIKYIKEMDKRNKKLIEKQNKHYSSERVAVLKDNFRKITNIKLFNVEISFDKNGIRNDIR